MSAEGGGGPGLRQQRVVLPRWIGTTGSGSLGYLTWTFPCLKKNQAKPGVGFLIDSKVP